VNQFQTIPVEIEWNSEMPVYASESFLRTVSDEYGWLAGIDASGKKRCVLPYTVVRKPGLRMIRFRSETFSLQQEFDEAEEREFLASVIEYFRSTGADMIIPSGNTALFRTCPVGALTSPYGTFVNDLTQTEEVLMSRLRPTHRSNIRKALQANVTIKCGLEYQDVAYGLVADTLKRSGMSFKTCREFKDTISSLGDNLKIFVAESEGAVQGCMVSPFSLHTAYNWYAGSRPEPIRGAMQLLHWEAMRQFRAMGVKRFNFQGVRIEPEKGSKQEGIMNYKKGFGGQLVQGCMWKYSFHPLKFAAYSVASRFLAGGDMQYKFAT